MTLTSQRSVPFWLGWSQLALLIALAALMTRWSADRALRAFLWLLPATLVGQLAAAAITQTDAWVAWARDVPAVVSFAALNGLKILPATTLVLTFIGSRLGRGDLFLTTGDLRARFRIREDARGLPWGALVAVAIPLTTLPLLAVVIGTRHPELPLSAALPFVPVIVVGAAANTLLEEFIFRQAPLARLLPAFGAEHAVAITAVRFGIGHWFGNPSGPLGVFLATMLGLFAAKCMLDCRGSGWVWLLHWINDLLIFTVIALTASSTFTA